MRRPFARVQWARRPRRFGAVLALVALLVHLALPGAAAFAMGGDALGMVPICTTAPAQGPAPATSHRALHTICPLCQAPSAVWGFAPPPVSAVLLGPDRLARVAWRHEATTGMPVAQAGSRARGPPGVA